LWRGVCLSANMLGMNAEPGSTAFSLLLLLLIPLYLVALMWVLSRLSGWDWLARRFSETGVFYGESWRWQSARFRGWFSYNNCLKVGASSEGLHLEVMRILIPFRLFHPPLTIPWNEIEVETGKAWFGLFDTARFRMGVEEQITMRVYGKIVDRVRRAAGAGWPLYHLERMDTNG